MIERRQDLTFKHNLQHARHNWLRLTPAYSLKIVESILDQHPNPTYVLDPFSGTGTTGLVCAERGIRCDLLDINPFLIWFAAAKTANYTGEQIQQAESAVREIANRVQNEHVPSDLWIPPMNFIERWWSQQKLTCLARLFHVLNSEIPQKGAAKDLVLIAFCRLLIEVSNAAFNHQSMSFKDKVEAEEEAHLTAKTLIYRFYELASDVLASARQRLSGEVQVILADSRCVPMPQHELYDCVITSPPYPNRMTYIRELRPYMYWLGYLQEAKEAGELDWQAIGGTWGIATSRLNKWKPNGVRIDYAEFPRILAEIADNSPLLANYVHKYFVDVVQHLSNLHRVLAPNAQLFYVVGNAKFYNTIVPTELIYAQLFQTFGFEQITIENIRKRSSKKELFEYVVSARMPSG